MFYSPRSVARTTATVSVLVGKKQAESLMNSTGNQLIIFSKKAKTLKIC